MAPGRRKGSGRAAAAVAAAARQHWKVGDLVLAKMKGFPAWPATVSEPEKWGFSSDHKKVLVYFYGTKQIAFCSHADIETFTEEKKKVLLNKRHGKGADFVRAVDEIIDVYENLKNKTHDAVALGDSFTTNSDSQSQAAHTHWSDSLCASTESSDVLNSEEILGASPEALCNTNTVVKELIESVSILDQLRETSLASTDSKTKLRDARSCAIQRKVPSLRRSRSSLNANPCKFQKSIMQPIDADQACGDLMTVSVQEEFTVRDKPICVVPSNTLCHDMDLHESADLVSCQRTDHMESEMVTLGPEMTHLNVCGISKPNCEFEQSGNGYLEKNDKLNGKLNIPVKTVILKRKRKQNRKLSTDATNCVKLNKEIELQNERLENLLELPNSCEETLARFQKADGDEHLPLVKRARVRMGKLHVEKVDADEIVSIKTKIEEEHVTDHTDKDAISSNTCDGCPADRASLEASDSLSQLPTNDCNPGSHRMSWKANKYQFNGSSLDDEAALPPSKRLHRALRAMSANAAEPLNDCPEALKTLDLVTTDCMDPPREDSHELLTDGRIGSTTMTRNLATLDDSVSHNALKLSSRLISHAPKLPVLASSEMEPDDIHTGKLSSSDDKDSSGCISETVDSEIHVRNLQTGAFLFSDKQVNAAPSEIMPDKTSSIIEEKENGILQSASRVDRVEGERPNVQKLVAISNSKESNGFLSPKDAGVVPSVENVVFTPSAMSQATSSFRLDGNAGSSDMQEVAKELKIKINPKDMGFSTDMTPMKVLIAAAQAKRLLYRSTSFSETDGTAVSCAARSPALNHGADYSERGSSPNPMSNPRPASDNRIHVLHSGTRSPHGSMLEGGLNKLRGLGEVSAARKSFEAILCTLSRTKESIGQATRLAIDYAKYGMAKEVIEILLHHLEGESNLYRRVDLFFLVDSITQCSHNQKGGAGDVYPSLVQSVLPRLLSMAAPPGNAARENRRQCLKVLRLWLERKTLPESILRYHIKELDSICENSFSTVLSRRPSQTERSLNDPVREMEGMLVDEYGSNTSFQFPGLLSSSVLEDEEEGGACVEKSYDAVTPERGPEVSVEKETIETATSERHRHILEDVDGELEMEDVAPPCEDEVRSNNYATEGDIASTSQCQFDQHHSLPFAPPLPEDKPPSPPPLPSSPPPIAPPSSGPMPMLTVSHIHSDAADMQHSNTKHNKQNWQTHCETQHLSNCSSHLIPSASVPYCISGYSGLPQQIPQPVSSLSSSGSYGNVSLLNPSVHSRISIQPSVSTSSPNVAYHLQPPRPMSSKQFSYVQGELHPRVQSWKTCSSFTKAFHFVNEKQSENFYGKGGTKAPINYDMAERGEFYPAVHLGPLLRGGIEASSMTLPYGPSSEPSQIPCHRFSLPQRASSYHSISSRPMLDPVSRVAGAPGYWRPS